MKKPYNKSCCFIRALALANLNLDSIDDNNYY